MANSLYNSELTVLWTVEQFSLSLVGKCFESAKFTSDSTKTRGALIFKRTVGGNLNVWIILEPYKDCLIDASLFLLAFDGTVLVSKGYKQKHSSNFCPNHKLEVKDIFKSRKEFLPDDKLTIRCVLKINISPTTVLARTRFELERVSFVWTVRNLSSFQVTTVSRLKMEKETKQLGQFELQLVFDRQGSMVVNLKPLGYSYEMIKSTFSVGLQDKNMKVFESLEEEKILGFNEEEKCHENEECLKHTLKFPGLLKKLAKNPDLYLPGGELSLKCEVLVNGKPIRNYIEKDFPVRNLQTTSISPEKREQQNSLSVGQSSGIDSTSCIFDDFKKLWNQKIFSDFQCHKCVLSTRSPVFHAMLTSSMAEAYSDSMEILDVDSNTLQRFLVFLYTDEVDNRLEWCEASRLYSVADKYQVLTLRERCSSILKTGLTYENICDALVFADLHLDDKDLNAVVNDFIGEHYSKVISNERWTNFLSENPQLAAKIMTEVLLRK